MAKRKNVKPVAMTTGSPVALDALLRSGAGKHRRAVDYDRARDKRAWKRDAA